MEEFYSYIEKTLQKRQNTLKITTTTILDTSPDYFCPPNIFRKNRQFIYYNCIYLFGNVLIS